LKIEMSITALWRSGAGECTTAGAGRWAVHLALADHFLLANSDVEGKPSVEIDLARRTMPNSPSWRRLPERSRAVKVVGMMLCRLREGPVALSRARQRIFLPSRIRIV